MRQINLLYIIDTSVGNFGGAEKQLGEIIRGLDRSKFKTVVIQLDNFHGTLKHPNNFIRGLDLKNLENITRQFWEKMGIPLDPPPFVGIKILTFPLKRILSYKGFWAAKLIKHVIERERIDILHTFFESSDILGTLVGRFSKTPFIISSRRDTGFSKNSRLLKCYKLLNNFVDLILVNAEAVREATIKKENIKSDKIKTIYNGIKVEKYKVKIDAAKKKLELGIDPEAPVIGIIANLTPVKGHSFFLDAAASVLQEFPTTNFVLIGEGPLEEKLKKQADELNILNRVKFLGVRKDIPELISLFDISVLSSLTEGCSNAILESMAGGKPVIATNVGGNPELVINGENGLIVPAQDSAALAAAECHLISNKAVAINMGEKGRARVERFFGFDKIIAEFEELYCYGAWQNHRR